jgi:hypothetical protein
MSARVQSALPRSRIPRFGLVLVLALGLGVAAPRASLGADESPPNLLLAGEIVNGPVVLDHIGLLFDEPLDPTSIPDPADFAYRINLPGPFPSPEPTPPPYVPVVGIELVYQGFIGSGYVFMPSTTGISLLRLDLGITVAQTDSISLRYTPGAHPLRDLAQPANEAPGFTDVAVDFAGGFDGVAAFVDDGLGPDRVLLVAAQALDPVLPPADDFRVTVNGVSQIPAGISLEREGFGLGFLVLTLATPIPAGVPVELTYVETAPVLTYLGAGAVGGFTNLPVELTIPATPSRLTPAGAGVVVSPPDSSTGTSPLTVTFDSVSSAGTTTLESSSTGAPPPAGFSFGDPPVYYELATDAVFTSATVCFGYSPNAFNPPESALRLMHFDGVDWVDVTLPGYPDTLNHRICGTVTSFSPFAVAGPAAMEFDGFRAPVDNLPVVNIVEAGSAVPVKFGLGGDFGLSIFATGSPASQGVECESGTPFDAIEETVSPGGATLTYDPDTEHYTYVWKTSRLWTGCRRLTLAFIDGSSATAMFRFP